VSTVDANLRFCIRMKLLELLNWSKGSQEEEGGDASAARSEMKAESRFHGRSKLMCPVTLSWKDGQGHTHTIRGRGVDMSGAGACVESSEPVAPGAYTVIQVPKLKLMGSAVVRHCMSRGKKFRIGLEFRNPLTKSF
jgi:hypothetical protein